MSSHFWPDCDLYQEAVVTQLPRWISAELRWRLQEIRLVVPTVADLIVGEAGDDIQGLSLARVNVNRRPAAQFVGIIYEEG
jgi:hypothetical protein